MKKNPIINSPELDIEMSLGNSLFNNFNFFLSCDPYYNTHINIHNYCIKTYTAHIIISILARNRYNYNCYKFISKT